MNCSADIEVNKVIMYSKEGIQKALKNKLEAIKSLSNCMTETTESIYMNKKAGEVKLVTYYRGEFNFPTKNLIGIVFVDKDNNPLRIID